MIDLDSMKIADGLLDIGAVSYYLFGNGYDLSSEEVEEFIYWLDECHPGILVNLTTEDIVDWIGEHIEDQS